MLDILKRACLFIGLVVGAGFATGKEITLYFGGASISTLILAGVMMGTAYYFFLIVGRTGVYQYMKNTRIGKLISLVMHIAAMTSFVVMVAGAEELLFEVSHLRCLGILTGIMTALIAPLGMRRIANINLIIVPLLMVIIVSVTGITLPTFNTTISIMRPLSYVGMNMLMGGYLVLEKGDKVTNREALLSSTIVSIAFSIMLILISGSTDTFSRASLPLYELARSKGVGILGAFIIYLAILSTLLGEAKLIFDHTYMVVRYKCISVSLVMILACIALVVPFGRAVEVVYSLIGVIGLIFLLYIALIYIYALQRHGVSSHKK